MEHGPDFTPRRFTATCGGETAFAGLSNTPPPAWLFRNGWNMARVVRIGAIDPAHDPAVSSKVRVEETADGSTFQMRAVFGAVVVIR